MSIADYLKADTDKLEKLIEEHPQSIPTKKAAEFLGLHEDSMRQFLENSNVGMSWRKPGKLNRGFYIPTGQFVRWYLNVKAM
ncbi:MAG: hypothetical protein Q4F95_07255 [Oscillospiraceae bacterium]|nr:hypothetical protein [Oscillospiraceae bacterium]